MYLVFFMFKAKGAKFMKNNHGFKEFIKYSSFSVLGMMGISCYILADTFFISKGLGANGLTALNLAIPIYGFLHGTGLMLGMGGGTKYTIFKSQKDMTGANRTFTSVVIIGLIFSLCFFLLALTSTKQIISWMGADEAVFDMSNRYLQTILLFSPMFVFNNIMQCFVRNDGAPQLSMCAMLSGSIFNIIFDYIFIFPCQMGIFGAALATGLSPIVSLLVLSTYFLRKKNHFHLIKCYPSKALLRSIFSSGFPSLVTEVSSGLVIIVFNSIILSLQGNIGVAAYGIIANISLVVMSIYTGIAQGIQPILSKNFGLGNHQQVKQILHYALWSVLILSSIIYALVFFNADGIASIFNSEQNPQLQSIAIIGLKLYFTSCLFAGCNIVLSIYFTSTNHAVPAHIISLLRGLVIIIPMAFLLSHVAEMNGIWSTLPLTEGLVCILAFTLYIRKVKQYKQRNNKQIAS